MSPYFKDFKETMEKDYNGEYKTPDEFIYAMIDQLAETELDASNRNQDMLPQVKAMADATITFSEANDKKLIYETMINDHHQWQYHRENGFTKIGVDHGNISTEVLRVLEGQVELNSMLNKAYIKANFENLTVVTGINFYPFNINIDYFARKVENFLALAFIAPALALGLPVFLYQVVLEKEKRLIQSMRINGLRMDNYWIVNFVFNFIMYSVVCISFMLIGAFFFNVLIFTDTSIFLLALTFFGWGLA